MTCHFNPARYARRLQNHRRFRERLPVPLLAVELSHDGEFELRDDDADIVLRRRSEAVLWQKERLLNVGIAGLPPGCDRVAWLDGDVLFEREDWHVEAARMLGDRVLLQLFDRFTDLPRDAAGPAPPGPPAPAAGWSFVALALQGGHDRELFEETWGHRAVRTGSGRREVVRTRNSGLAWAARRDLLGAHGLYDACILGSGDRAIACAAFGRAADAALAFLRNDAQRRHYLAWAGPFARAVAGRIGCVEGTVAHLWHGELADRGYRERWTDPDAQGFDPHEDLVIDAGGCWSWATDKPLLHAHARRYFTCRREDGRPERDRPDGACLR